MNRRASSGRNGFCAACSDCRQRHCETTRMKRYVKWSKEPTTGTVQRGGGYLGGNRKFAESQASLAAEHACWTRNGRSLIAAAQCMSIEVDSGRLSYEHWSFSQKRMSVMKMAQTGCVRVPNCWVFAMGRGRGRGRKLSPAHATTSTGLTGLRQPYLIESPSNHVWRGATRAFKLVN